MAQGKQQGKQRKRWTGIKQRGKWLNAGEGQQAVAMAMEAVCEPQPPSQRALPEPEGQAHVQQLRECAEQHAQRARARKQR